MWCEPGTWLCSRGAPGDTCPQPHAVHPAGTGGSFYDHPMTCESTGAATGQQQAATAWKPWSRSLGRLRENQEIITISTALVFQNVSFPSTKSGPKFQIPAKKYTILPLAVQTLCHTYRCI